MVRSGRPAYAARMQLELRHLQAVLRIAEAGSLGARHGGWESHNPHCPPS